MKLKTRIILGFTMIILMPLLLFAATLYGFSQSQKTQVQTESDGTVYDISITDSADSQGRVHVMAKDAFYQCIYYSDFCCACGWSVGVPKHCRTAGETKKSDAEYQRGKS